jgi:nitrile hydratase
MSRTFNVGDQVRVRQDAPGGNPRTPRYIRGKRGFVVTSHGVIVNPLDHRGLYPPLYTVMFEIKDVFGRPSTGKLCVDIHEDWLTQAS